MSHQLQAPAIALSPKFGKTQCGRFLKLFAFTALLLMTVAAVAQTAGTGAIAGMISDSSGAAVAGASISIVNSETGETRTVTTTGTGTYLVPLLKPGTYHVEVTKQGFKKTVSPDVAIHVTETATANLKLEVGAANESVTVTGSEVLLKTQDVTMGQVVDEKQVSSLPLVTRNYTQILGLSTGVSAEVFNAGEIGRGGVDSGISSNGSAVTDNNFQMNGVEINDTQGSGHFSGGVAIPNPDSIQEFKVQTSQFDASSGRSSGANVDVVTKSGTNSWHGSAWEYFRNEALNANSYFNNQTGQPRGIMRQNQWGGTIGGPIVKNKLLFFGSYQGTDQKNGVDQNCSSSAVMPVLTNSGSSRTAQQLADSVGINTAFGGYDIGGNGPVTAANISPQALALFNYKLPNGQYMIPDAQTIKMVGGLPEGFSTFSSACPYTEQQFMVNLDWLKSSKSTWTERFFFSNTSSTQTIPAWPLGPYALPGSPQKNPQDFRNFSLSNTYVFTNNLVNQAEFGFTRTVASVTPNPAYAYSDIGVTAPSYDNTNPSIAIAGGFSVGGGQMTEFAQNTFTLQDNLSWNKGRHSIRMGGGFNRLQINDSAFAYPGVLVFGNYPGLMLGSAPYNPYQVIDLPGDSARYWRIWEGNLYIQDDWKVTSRLTLNLGFRYERLGDPGEIYGRNATMDPSLINPNPTDAGSLDGFVVANNYPGTLPEGVTTSGNDLALKGIGQNTWNPRIGFAWRLPGSERYVLRAGYGVYHQRITGQPFFQQLTNQPWAMIQQLTGSAGFGNPFPPDPGPFPQWIPYSPSTVQAPFIVNVNLRPPLLQKYSMNLQAEVAKDLVLEIGYAGMRSTHTLLVRGVNQANLASPTDPIRTETDNTYGNIQQRVPYLGFSANSMQSLDSDGFGWYNALVANLNKRFSHGLQFLASYTWARNLTNANASVNAYTGGSLYGDQNDSRRNYGPDSFVRPHRFVANGLYQLPGPKDLYSLKGQFLGNWQLSGVFTWQSGHRLTLATTSYFNVYGVAQYDFAEITPGCNLQTSGSTTARLNNWVNAGCMAQFPTVGADGLATGFGNSSTGIITGPGQVVTDMAISKFFPLSKNHEQMKLEFRSEFFNLFNHPIFADPHLDATPVPGALGGASITNPSFGTITNTSSNPRIIQFALKFNF